MAYTCKARMNISAVHLCADRVWCQLEVSMVREWDVKVLSNSISPMQITKYILLLKLGNSDMTNPTRTYFLQWPDFDLTLQNPGSVHHYWSVWMCWKVSCVHVICPFPCIRIEKSHLLFISYLLSSSLYIKMRILKS